MSDELLHLVRQRIRVHGPLRFDDFMSLALYSDPHGYYRSHVPGADSDYHTSGTLTPWFGRLVGRRLQQMWTELGSPPEFTVAEVGGGTGDLALAALDAAGDHPDFDKALRWTFVEPMPAVADLQESRLGRMKHKVGWVDALEHLGRQTGTILANEVLDNFPFRVFEVGEYGVLEVRVDATRGHLHETLVPAATDSDPALLAPLEHLEIGDRFEVHTGIQAWVGSAATALESGRVLVIDYGDLEPDLWTRRPAGSMVTYRRGQLGLDPFEHLGGTDITAHVNFSDLGRRLSAAGLEVQTPVAQREWLRSLGIANVVDDLRRQEAHARDEGRHPDWASAMAERSRVQTLVGSPLGDYLVLEASAVTPAR
ncbi:MAG: SAM-dependent methyltransferase [Actinomycetota bacterium]